MPRPLLAMEVDLGSLEGQCTMPVWKPALVGLIIFDLILAPSLWRSSIVRSYSQASHGLSMIEIILYSGVAFFSLWTVIISVIRILTAENSQSRKKAALSLIGAFVMILISITAIYLRFYDLLSSLTVALASSVLLI